MGTKDQHHPPFHSSVAMHRASVPEHAAKIDHSEHIAAQIAQGYCYIAGSGITRRGASGKLRHTVVPRPGVDVIVSVPA